MDSIEIQRIRSLCTQLLESAAAEARSLQHPYLGTEHLFITLTRQVNGETERILAAAGIDPAQAREEIRREVGREKDILPGFPPCTPRLMRVLGLAEKAAGSGQPILERHLLGALLKEGENIAVRYLRTLGTDCEAWAERLSEGAAEHTCLSMAQDADGTRLGLDIVLQKPEPAGINVSGVQPGPAITPLQVPATIATPTLDKYGRDLSRLARLGKLSEVVSREAELEQIITILARTQKANPLLLGEPGVGKTAIVEGLAWRIAKGTVPDIMKDKRIIQVDMGDLTADTELRGQFERRVKQIIKEASEAPEVILFIDEIHTLVGAGESMHAALDAAQMFKPALAHGDFSCIGATTQNEFFRYIRRDPALERRFSPVLIKELNPEVNLIILEKVAERILEKQANAGYALSLASDVLISALRLTDQYIRDRNQPDKSIDIIDLACAKSVVRGNRTVTSDDIARVVSEWTGIPLSRMDSDEKQRYAQMENALNALVIGQQRAVAAVSGAIRSALAGMKAPHRPVGVFLFVGPTGVGKTKLAKELANFLFQSPQALLRFDMNEYKESHTISNLIGSARGYVGSEQGGLLCEGLRKRPYSVVLLDEIDKAHPEILDLFLSIFDDGRLTDNQGRQVDCSNALFIMTSNHKFGSGGKIGFGAGETTELTMEAAIRKSGELRKQVSEFIRPELVNRITEVIEFPALQREDFRAILEIILKERIAEFGAAQQIKVDLEVLDSAKELILDLGYDPRMGARSLERAVEQVLIHPLVDVLYNEQNTSTEFIAAAKDRQMVFLTREEFEDYEESCDMEAYMPEEATEEAETMHNSSKLKLPRELEKYRDKLEESVKPFIRITAEKGKTLAWESKFGGNPYLPLGYEYPKDPEGNPLRLLAQINFEEMPDIGMFPLQGILQLYISAGDDVYGMDFDQPTSQEKFRVVYIPEVIKDYSRLVKDFGFVGDDGEYLPIEAESKLQFKVEYAPVGTGDFRFEKLFNTTAYNLLEDELYEWYEKQYSSAGHKMGGYAYFTQSDPRDYDYKEYDILLLQIDTDCEADIMWGDSGVANFFIRPEDLKNLDFSKVLYNWDCC